MRTADICDTHAAAVAVAEPALRLYGGRECFGGPIRTVRVFEDNVLVRQAVERPGDGAVLVVDGGGSRRCALLGDVLAGLAAANGWSGVVVHGCIRDSLEIGEIDLGVAALATMPLKSRKRGEGERDVVVVFAGVEFRPGEFLYADSDGIVVSPTKLD